MFSDEVRWYVAEQLFPESYGALQSARMVRQPHWRDGAERGQQRTVDQELLESLASSVTLALQRGVWVGVR